MPDIHQGEKLPDQEFWAVVLLARDDLESQGWDVSDLSDEDISKITKSICQGILEGGFWDIMNVVMDELGYKKKEN